jgi:uncharacterized protein YjcR
MNRENEGQPQLPRLGQLLNGGIPCDITKLPRCQATAKKTGKRCRLVAMKGKKVCYLHGGRSPGAPQGNKNALKHGHYAEKSIRERKQIRDIINRAKETIDNISLTVI